MTLPEAMELQERIYTKLEPEDGRKVAVVEMRIIYDDGTKITNTLGMEPKRKGRRNARVR